MGMRALSEDSEWVNVDVVKKAGRSQNMLRICGQLAL